MPLAPASGVVTRFSAAVAEVVRLGEAMECARMELPRDLMVQRDHWDGSRCLEPQYLEQRDQIVGDPEVVTLGAADFIVPEFE